MPRNAAQENHYADGQHHTGPSQPRSHRRMVPEVAFGDSLQDSGRPERAAARPQHPIKVRRAREVRVGADAQASAPIG